MANLDFQRQLAQIFTTYDGDMTVGSVVESSNKFYLPLALDNFNPPDLTITAINGTSAATKLTGASGKFDNVRVGDVISATSVGTFTALTDVTITDAYLPNGKKYIVYPASASFTNVMAGDAITGTSVGVGAVIDRVDTANRIIYVTVANTAESLEDVTIERQVRVTAVRTSTATANANEIDINTSVATTITNSTLTIEQGAKEAIFAVARLEPITNTTGTKFTVAVSVAYLDGLLVKGSLDGLSGLTLASLNYLGLGSIQVDGDAFLLNARYPRPDAV